MSVPEDHRRVVVVTGAGGRDVGGRLQLGSLLTVRRLSLATSTRSVGATP
jgi:hypothetical protein